MEKDRYENAIAQPFEVSMLTGSNNLHNLYRQYHTSGQTERQVAFHPVKPKSSQSDDIDAAASFIAQPNFKFQGSQSHQKVKSQASTRNFEKVRRNSSENALENEPSMMRPFNADDSDLSKTMKNEPFNSYYKHSFHSRVQPSILPLAFSPMMARATKKMFLGSKSKQTEQVQSLSPPREEEEERTKAESIRDLVSFSDVRLPDEHSLSGKPSVNSAMINKNSA